MARRLLRKRASIGARYSFRTRAFFISVSYSSRLPIPREIDVLRSCTESALDDVAIGFAYGNCNFSSEAMESGIRDQNFSKDSKSRSICVKIILSRGCVNLLR